jgi:hypothetical protein
VQTGTDGWIGYTVSQGRRFEEGRTCEDMIFTSWHGQLALVLMVDGHGGHGCAQFVIDSVRDRFPAEFLSCGKTQELLAGVMPPPHPLQASRGLLACGFN